MALIVSNVIAKASGSINGIVMSHNKGGMYIRNRSTPTNPNTTFQQTNRNAITLLSTRWTNTLTQAQRDAWAVWAANVTRTNKVGEARNNPPNSWYNAFNTPRIQASLSIIDAAPTTFVLPSFTDPGFTVTAATDDASITFGNTDAWAALGGGLLFWASRPQSAGIVYFRGPFRFADSVNGAAVPPVSPQVIALPFAVAAGNVVFWKVRATNPDARLSTERYYRTVAV